MYYDSNTKVEPNHTFPLYFLFVLNISFGFAKNMFVSIIHKSSSPKTHNMQQILHCFSELHLYFMCISAVFDLFFSFFFIFFTTSLYICSLFLSTLIVHYFVCFKLIFVVYHHLNVSFFTFSRL